MINPKDTVDAINAIPLAVSSARTSVVESLSRLGKKCDVMQEYHLEVGSEDPVIQKFIESRDEILQEMTADEIRAKAAENAKASKIKSLEAQIKGKENTLASIKKGMKSDAASDEISKREAEIEQLKEQLAKLKGE